MPERNAEAQTPEWFNYPPEFLRLIDQGIVVFLPWKLLLDKEFSDRLKGLAERYPKRKLVPFARRIDCDDIACWERNEGEKVFIIHDFASPGYEARDIHPDFWSWFRSAIEDMMEFEP